MNSSGLIVLLLMTLAVFFILLGCFIRYHRDATVVRRCLPERKRKNVHWPEPIVQKDTRSTSETDLV